MPLPTGAPDPSVVVYAIQRGEYDQFLYEIDKALHQRRDSFDRLGIIQPSRGDWVEIWGDDPTMDVKIPTPLLNQRLRVVGFTADGRLRCRIEAPIQTEKRTYERGAILKVSRDWVYRVHYAP